MKKNNQLGILKMVARDFNDNSYSNRIIADSENNNFAIEITRDFINTTVALYTVDDIINMSLENNGNVFGAILKDISRVSRQQTKEKFENM